MLIYMVLGPFLMSIFNPRSDKNILKAALKISKTLFPHPFGQKIRIPINKSNISGDRMISITITSGNRRKRGSHSLIPLFSP